MRAGLLRAFTLLFCAFVIGMSALAEEPKSAAYKAYTAQAGMIATQAVASELNRHPDQAKEIQLDLRFKVDLQGRVHNAKVLSSKPDQWTQETARRILAGLKLPPIPEELAAEIGAAPIDVVATFEVGVFHTGNKSVSRDSPDTVAYLKEVDNIICSALQIEILKRTERSADLTITLLIDHAGHVRAQEILSARSSEWLKETAKRVIRTAKLPPMPEKVAAEHKDGLVAFRTQWIYDRKD